MRKEKGITSVTIRLTEGTEEVLSIKEAEELYNNLHLLFGRTQYPFCPPPVHVPLDKGTNPYEKNVWY